MLKFVLSIANSMGILVKRETTSKDISFMSSSINVSDNLFITSKLFEI